VKRSLDANSRKRVSRAPWLSAIFCSPWFGSQVARKLSFGATIQNRNQHRALTLRAELKSLNPRFDDGVRTVPAAGPFRVPRALVILVLDGFRVARDFLLRGGRPRGSERLGMGREVSENTPLTL